MFNTTLPRLRCPICTSGLSLEAIRIEKCDPKEPAPAVFEVTAGRLRCKACPGSFPILAGVAILTSDVAAYLVEHVKGIAQSVKDEEIPAEFREAYFAAKAEIIVEHIEEDLEAERVVSLYMMNHYLSTQSEVQWWKAAVGTTSPLMDSLIRENWDHGPLAKIAEWIAEQAPIDSVIELGCGVGGLCGRIAPYTREYLGIDSSFASISLGRHLALGVPYSGSLRIPNDLLSGPVAHPVTINAAGPYSGMADLIVGDIEALPVENGVFDLSVVLNAIDMMADPQQLPDLQAKLVRPGGTVIQSCPYIWHEFVARELRARLPAEIQDSASAVEWMYEQAGLTIQKRIEHLPWLFFKHVRQLEIYSVHLFSATKG